MENNNIHNDSSGFEPEKPFTDKTNPNVQLPQGFGQQSAEQFNEISDEQFFEQTTSEPYSQEQSPATDIPTCATSVQNPVPPYQQPQFNPQQPPYTDYSRPVYQRPAPFNLRQAYDSYNQVEFPVNKPQNNYQRYQAPPVNPQMYNQPPQANPQAYNHPPQATPQAYNHHPQANPPYTYPRYSTSPYHPMPAPQKKSSNTALIVIIIVLSILLLVSFSGICLIIGSSNQENNNNNSYTTPEHNYTIPNFGNDESQNTTPSHDESDYSNQTDPSFKGIELEGKPLNKFKGTFSAEYAFDSMSDSVVGIVCYADKITTVEKCDSQGSGIIITSDGYVVTNAHVIGNSKTAYIIQVITADGKTYDAGVVGFDSRTDIAVLKIDDAKNLKAATFGDSEEIELGEDIIVIGNPGGLDYQNSITKGIVSAVDRKLSSTSLVKYIQTDAAINPGNSGGPIVNLYGQVIGIAPSKIVSEHYEGMGFAIPSATAKDIIDDLVQKGYVQGRVKIGIAGLDLSSSDMYGYNLPEEGILIQEITEDGPCDGTSLSKGDIIIEADGQSVTCFADMYEILEEHKAGDKIKLKYYRPTDDSYNEIEVILQADEG